MHGGGEKIENIENIDEENKLVLSRRGYSLISIKKDKLTVELFDEHGKSVYSRIRNKNR